MKVRVSNNCICCGACLTISPEVFEIYLNSAIVDPNKILGREESCIDAALSCPVSAIIIDE
ncbi:ferredoxin [bacterium]|nr:ferredoxin [bacterium]